MARAIANAFADLDATEQRARLERELGELNAIGIQLSAERNLDVLLETILTKAREITRADAGSLYLVEENADGPPRLRFAVAQCESVDIPFRAVSLPLDHKSVAGYVALTGAIVNLADAYTPPGDRRSRSTAGSTTTPATARSRCWWCRCGRPRARRSARSS